MKNTINSATCDNCRLCFEICPADIIFLDENKHTYFKEELQYLCVTCGQCMAVCPSQSVQVAGLSYEHDLFPLPENKIDFAEFYNFLSARRSVRNFKKKEVEKQKLQQILDSIALAPYGMDAQAVHITLVTDPGILEISLSMMSSFYDKIEKWMRNPIARHMMKRNMDPAVYATVKNHILPMIQAGHYNPESGDDNILRNAPALLIFHAPHVAEEHEEDSMIYVTYAALAAHALGLGATIIGLVAPAINKTPELRNLFNIPEDHHAVISLIIGYPKFKYKRAIKREKKNVQWLY